MTSARSASFLLSLLSCLPLVLASCGGGGGISTTLTITPSPGVDGQTVWGSIVLTKS